MGLELNRFATSGVTPAGQPSDYQPVYRYLPRGSENVVSASSEQQTRSIRFHIDQAASIALDIRTNQYFRDGNHRTALLTAILYLSLHSIVLTSKFRIYRAYTIISARFHPGNESNTLSPATRTFAQQQFVKYLRRRTARRVVEPEYLTTMADAVRKLPVTVARVEAMAVKLRQDRESSLQRAHHRSQAEQVLLRWTFPEFSKPR
uniref:Fido domain-containing protein n=1 Tax=Mycena chlorophos TaxID=658473 RepID=A0ABQ0L567_MYCCL|nr:predicted protein [Mycena chlorophos]